MVIKFLSAVKQNNPNKMLKSRLCLKLFFCFFILYNGLWGSEPGKQISFYFDSEPLRSALGQLSEKHHINFIFDDALVDNIFITCDVINEYPRVAFNKLLQPYQLSCEFLNQNTVIIYRKTEQIKPYHYLKGRVSDAETGLPLACANACIQGRNIGSATDLYGNFTFIIPDSAMQLIVSYMGYETKVLQVTPQSNKLDIKLNPQPFEFNSIIITAPRNPEEVEQISRTQLSQEYFIGVIPVISSEMTYASFMSYNNNEAYIDYNNGNFYIKITGNRLHPMIGTDRNNRLAFKQHQVNLNGFNLQMPFHTSIIPALNPGIVNYDLIQTNNYQKTIFDVEYKDAYESVMDLDYRKGNQNTICGKATIDLTNSGFMLEGPLAGTASWIITGKKNYNNDLLNSINKDKWMLYNYYDFYAQLDFQPTDQHNTRIDYIYSSDQMSFDPKIRYTRERQLHSSSSSQQESGILAEESIQEINTINNRFGLNGISAYDIYQISNQWKSELAVSYALHKYNNIWGSSFENETWLPEEAKNSYNYLWREGKGIYFNVKTSDEKFILHYGTSAEYSMKTGVHFKQMRYNAFVKNNFLVQIQDNISEPPNYNGTFYNTNMIKTFSWFYQEERHLLEKLRVQAGVRYDYFNLQQNGRLNPRIMINYDLPLEIKIKAAFGTFSRLPDFGEIQQYMLERIEPGYKPGNSKIECDYTNKYTAGIEKSFLKNTSVEFSYFYKSMNNLMPIQRLSDGSLLYDVKNKAKASSHGFDVNARLYLNMFSLMCSYKYSDSFEHTAESKKYSFYADQRHSLLLSLNATLPNDWYVGLQSIYGSGYAYTPCVLPDFDWELGYDLDSSPMWEYQTSSPNSTRYPGYSRLDLMFRKGFTLPFGKISISANLINLLNTHHTFSYIYTYDQNGKPIRQAESLSPFFPQVGLAYEF